MRTRPLIWHLVPPNLAITLVALLTISWLGTSTIDDFAAGQVRQELVGRAMLLRRQVHELLAADEPERLQTLCRQAGREASTRITVIRRDGTVVADSNEDPATMANHADRPELIQALSTGRGESERYSTTLGERLIYIAIALPGGTETATATLRMSVPITALQLALQDVHRKIALGVVLTLAAAALVSRWNARRLGRPIEAMDKAAADYVKGEKGRSLAIPDRGALPTEIHGLAESLEQMAVHIEERIATIIRQRNELEEVFSSMTEPVIAVDGEERIRSMNDAAMRLFGLQEDKVRGRTISELIRNLELQKQVREALRSKQHLESEIVLHESEGHRYLQTRLAPLRDGAGETVGVLVVMNDTTKLRRLEQIRSDFVANVSHELFTPITSIKGYVETLLDGALDDPEQARNFLAIVGRQTSQLQAIITDLLTLSRIEQEAERQEIVLRRCRVEPVLRAAEQTSAGRAAEKNIRLICRCPLDLEATINDTLLEQALVNLMINAIKYSNEGGEVLVEAQERRSARGGQELCLTVIDQGIGIGREHLPRLFERFYRSDKARSRKLGGTGLGLAIVKHIVQSHGGTVGVESEPGRGSTFTMVIPEDKNHKS
ncbi:MAG: hypothetical protein BWK76_14210 [Desulfobulbaceae bacterium A2]|nr:MAG: hypothetical protein BWK76_14210 [Desulfobulbaceae bacterium A2]